MLLPRERKIATRYLHFTEFYIAERLRSTKDHVIFPGITIITIVVVLNCNCFDALNRKPSLVWV